jgi:NADH:ubiquinone reductase (H+-translocating)
VKTNTKETGGQVISIDEEQQKKPTTVPHVVIVGAGFGGLEAAKALGHLPVEVTVIDHNNFHLFQPMLYQVATAGLAPSDIATPIREVLRKQQNTGVLMAEVVGIDTEEQQVLLQDDKAMHYDYLILATGATSNYFGHPQWAHIAPSMKTLDEAVAVRRLVLSAFEAAEREPDEEKRKALLTFVLVGGGPTGVELAGALAELTHQALKGNFRHIRPDHTRIVLVQGGQQILKGFPASLAQQSEQKLRQMGVEVIKGVHVEEVNEHGARVKDEFIETENVIWTAGVKASPAGTWLHAAVDHDGRVKVQPDLTVPGHDTIFVIGDTALVTQRGKPLPGLAPVAMQEGRYVASVIGDRIAGKEQHSPFHYFDKGTLATVGRSFGVVAIGPLRFTGLLAWWIWLLVHILFLIGTRNRLIVFLQYAWYYITWQRGARVILPEGHVRAP